MDDGSFVFDRTARPPSSEDTPSATYDWTQETVKPTGGEVTEADREKATGFHVPESPDDELAQAFDAVVMAMRVRHQNPNVWRTMRQKFSEVFGGELKSAVVRMPLDHVLKDATHRLAEEIGNKLHRLKRGKMEAKTGVL